MDQWKLSLILEKWFRAHALRMAGKEMPVSLQNLSKLLN